MIKKIIQYISYDIWFKKEHEYRSSKVRWAVRQFKVFLFTAQGFAEHSILVKSAALTFYTLMSLVPIAPWRRNSTVTYTPNSRSTAQ